MATVLPAKDDWAEVFRNIGKGAGEGYINRSDEMALQKAVGNLHHNATPREILDAITNTKTYRPGAKQEALKNYMGVAEFEESRRKSQKNEEIAEERNRVAALGKKGQGDAEQAKQNYLLSGYPEYEADLLINPDVTPATKQQIAKQHADLTARGLRQPATPEFTETPQDSPIDPQESNIQAKDQIAPKGQEINPIEQVAEQMAETIKPEWPEIPPPPQTTFAEKEKWRSGNQKENNKILQETNEKNKKHTNSLIRYNRASTLNDTHKLPEGLGRIVIDPFTSEPRPLASLFGLVNKETQNFVKTINDFLAEAQGFFGGKVSNFEVSSFKSRLPTLLNTEDGRRIVLEQMRLMEELESIHDVELEKGLKHYGRNASYSDIQRIVDENVADEQAAIIGKLNNLDEAAGYLDVIANDPKLKDYKLMQDPEGQFRAVPGKDVAEALREKWTAW